MPLLSAHTQLVLAPNVVHFHRENNMKIGYVLGLLVIGLAMITRGTWALHHGIDSFPIHGRGPGTPYGAIVLGAVLCVVGLIYGVLGEDKNQDDSDKEGNQ